MRSFLILTLALAGGLASQPRAVAAQAAVRTTFSGVYTAAQATRGQETFAFNCQGCHTPASYTGEQFTKNWIGKPLAELYNFISTAMPKSEPGSLSEGEYAQLVAYLLKLNQMPAGDAELKPDTLELRKIQFVGKPK